MGTVPECGSGKDLKQVQGWLRHSRLSTTLDSYVHEVDGGLGSADALDEIVQLGDNGVTTPHPQPAAEGSAVPPLGEGSQAENGDQPQVTTGAGTDS